MADQPEAAGAAGAASDSVPVTDSDSDAFDSFFRL